MYKCAQLCHDKVLNSKQCWTTVTKILSYGKLSLKIWKKKIKLTYYNKITLTLNYIKKKSKERG